MNNDLETLTAAKAQEEFLKKTVSKSGEPDPRYWIKVSDSSNQLHTCFLDKLHNESAHRWVVIKVFTDGRVEIENVG